MLTNVNCFSSDGGWMAYDVRSRQGEIFDGDRIERVRIADGFIDTLFSARDGASVGVASYNPAADEVAFILGPAHPTADFSYGPSRRQGVIVDCQTKHARNLDARDLTPPFTPGALRGGTHVHVFSPDGQMVSSTYEDEVLARLGTDASTHDLNRRTVAVSVLGYPVKVAGKGPRDHDGTAFTFVAVRTTNAPRAGSDEVAKAYEDSWVGRDGYLRADGARQHKAIAFQGDVVTADGMTITEVFIVDLPDDPTRVGDGPIEGTRTRRPAPPLGCGQRRLTFTAGSVNPGIQGPRHWLRSSPDGSMIAFLMKDETGIAQLWTISPNGGAARQVTHNETPIASAFTWSNDGRSIAHVMDGRVCVTDVPSGMTTPLTAAGNAIWPQACVFSPDSRSIAYVASTPARNGQQFDQIWLVDVR